MKNIKIVISHSIVERELARAWQKLLGAISLNAIDVWFSSDTEPLGGMTSGKDWREDLYKRIKECDLVIAIQTPVSAGKSWIMWECGVASGVDKERDIIPIVYNMERGGLSNPLNVYQAYRGDDVVQVRELCERLLLKADLPFERSLYTRKSKSYFSSIQLYLSQESASRLSFDASLWNNRIDDFIRSNRVGELRGLRDRMYAPQGKRPIDLSIHELLSQVFLENKNFQEALEETEYALALKPNDVVLLHRKALVFTELKEYDQAKKIIAHVIALHKNLDTNTEIASLQGRIYREQWQSSHNSSDLEKALSAYLRAYQADPSSYYTGVNVIGLAFAKGDTQLGEKTAHEVLSLCEQEQKSSDDPSYWVDFAAGEVYLALGNATQAIDEYEKGLKRHPQPQQRQRHSAANGAERMIRLKNLPNDVLDRIDALLR